LSMTAEPRRPTSDPNAIDPEQTSSLKSFSPLLPGD